MKNFWATLGALIILGGFVIGLFIVVVAPIEMFKKAEAETWPSRKAVITQSYTRFIRGSARNEASYWKAEVCGKYYDNGEKFCVWRIRYGGFRFGDGKRSALETIAKYPVGHNVDIYYSQDNPKETVLESRSSWSEMLILLGVGVIFILIPILLWLFRKKINPTRYDQ